METNLHAKISFGDVGKTGSRLVSVLEITDDNLSNAELAHTYDHLDTIYLRQWRDS